MFKLENGNTALTFDQNGSLAGVYSKVSDWHILDRQQLALSWRLMLPLDGRRNNNAWGHMQKQPRCEQSQDKLVFTWDKIASEYGGEHDISVTTTCEIVVEQAIFSMKIANNADCVVENVYYPYLGDLHRPIDCAEFGFSHGNYCAMQTHSLYPTFHNYPGTHGTDYPTMCVEGYINPPMYPFGVAADEKGNSLYFGVTQRRLEAVTWHAELHPGWINALDFRAIDEDSFDGLDVFTRFTVGHLPFVMPKSEFELLPFAMQCYVGDWACAAEIYRGASKQWNTLPKQSPAWVKEPHSWLQIHINSPEDELRVKFKDLPEKVGRECQKYGIDAIQLVGWNYGGQDRGNPTHTPDPRLGTFDELKQSIKEIQAMGVKVILFAKFTWADESNDDFHSFYKPMAVKDPYGNYYVSKGYTYNTLSQLTNINTRRLIPMCFGSDEYLEVCKREFMKCVELGADGILYDESQHHTPTMCCFDTSHGHKYGASTYAWDERLIETFREMVRDKDFLIAGEAIYDFQFNYYDLSYTRTFGRKHKPVSRAMRPDGQIMTAVIGFGDRSMVNQCLLNRYVISYEPYNFKGYPSDFPKTVEYGKKMDKLRAELREYFWDGEFMSQHGGSVKANCADFDSYSVFRGTNGKYGMVVCNYTDEAIYVEPKLECGSLTQYRLVEGEMCDFAGGFDLPPLCAAVVM